MSWSFQVVGKPEAVARVARETKTKNICTEPEETIRQAALELMAVSAEAQAPNVLVRASGSGSMWKEGDVVKQNNLKMEVEPIYGLVE